MVLQLYPDTVLFVYCLQPTVLKTEEFPEEFLGNWEEGGYSYLFFVGEADSYIVEMAARQGLELVDRHTIAYGQWQEEFSSPVEASGLHFLPWWSRDETIDQEQTIYLDTSVVFGDGLHPTTRACLSLIQKICSTQRVATMLDLGSGSGILALAARKFGCSRVAAVDNTFLAAQTTRRNALLNGYGEEILTINGRAEEVIAGPSDLLVANIQPPVIHKILDSRLFCRTKRYIFSGIQHHEADRVVDHLRHSGGELLGRFDTGDAWQTMWGEVKEQR